MKTLDEIKYLLSAHKQELLNKYSLKEIGIFGSLVRNEHNRSSDIDILVDFSRVPDLLQYIEIEDYLKKILKMKVDMVLKTSLRKELKKDILKETVYI